MPDVLSLLPMLVLLIVIGGFAGVIAGLLGVGGGIVLVPAFFYTFSHLGYDGPQLMQVCLGTSLATIMATAMRSVNAHNRKGAVDWAVLRGWAPAIGGGAVLGFLLATQLKSVTLQAVFGTLGLIAGAYMAFGRPEWRLGETMPTGGKRWALGGGLGLLSVLMGIGGGTFGVPMMTLYAMPIHRAVATASGFGLIIAVPSAIGFLLMPVEGAPPYSLGAVNLPAFVVIVAMTLLTTPYGVRLAHAMNPKPLKRAFALFLIVVALNMLRKVAGW
ncbi:sulfite exporter TauE/SafE family protein [Gemmobacter fulvus]|uniref:Probable membrane transporter protein n=1 Tax=Gemmobacter fulvus TaxID=2840474 RepID=A0A975S363_9RHOB|nr:sulfite exporter TauE/SafE family protein [Gemmobacter fulvus]MBT9243930.1 sulfite exporter TauE/SafE family protein [Gemmobacter fulvus]QWK91880.1 sulfite exporter TauE/SafE family protein [Gemmobacter fulvus]